MQTIVSRLFDFVGPRAASPDFLKDESSSHKLLATAVAALLALGASAMWGVVVGAHGHLSIANVLTVPMLITASALASLPLALFVAKLTSSSLRVTDLLLAYVSSAFAGCTALLLLSPLVAIYQQSSSLVGSAVGPASAFLAFVVGAAVFVRANAKLVGRGASAGALIVPVVLLVLLQGAAIVQLASLSHPLFGQRTSIGHGIDALSQPSSESQEP